MHDAVNKEGSRDVFRYYFSYWNTTENQEIDFQREVELFKERYADPPLHTPVVVAKSAGVIFSKYLIEAGLLEADQYLFLGLPVHWAEERGEVFLPWLAAIAPKVTVLQNEDDPAISFSDLTALCEASNLHIRLKMLDGHAHEYNQFDVIADTVKSLEDKK